ncbi:TonB-dependent receptor [Aliifodinibius salicampi]|uniref:TonB-dependent receptor n=1 Tax=Fodinibius salicampi TaxID=1920655 RepID=A0ABT3PZF7_9BACT|nr:TonB-dependent receptor [Fodinibius salicampi]MCW9713252.1 TonB-dependent receptor [Fodinibius salicampi]
MKTHIPRNVNFKALISLGVFVLALMFSGVTMAQDTSTISGTVTDQATGETLPGVNILVKGTAIGASTNLNGEYELDVPSLNDTLVVSYVGYTRSEIPINGRTSLDIELQPQAIEGDEVFVTGYTSQRQADITGAVSEVSVEDMNRTTSASFLDKMKGRIAGVNVESSGSPGSANTVRIRGVSSFQNNDPLYIIDGTPIQGDYNNFLNPNDIESMQVLKDASAASIYGSRANNGVVIITTKKGSAGAPEVSFDANWGVATPVSGYSDILMQDPFNYHEIIKRSHDNAGLSTPTNIYGDPENPSIPNYIWPNDGTNQTMDLQAQFGITEEDYEICNCDRLIMPASQGTDWWDELFDPALTQSYNLNISGGNEGAVYNLSFNYYDQEGTMRYNFYKKGTIRVNTEFEAGIFTFGENASFTVDQQSGGMQSGAMGEDTPIGQLIKMQPIIPVHDIGGYYAGAKANTLGNGSNPVAQVWKNRHDVTETNAFVGNAFATASIMENLEFKSNFGFNIGRNRFEGMALPTPENSEPNSVTSLNENFGVYTNWNWSNTLNYAKTFNQNHNLDVLAGTEANRENNRSIGASMAGYSSTSLNTRYIRDALGDPGTKAVNSFGGYSTLLSFFGKADYNYAEKYYLSATLRHDGSSRLGANNRWGTFPAFSVGWRVSEESFMDGLSGLSDLKIRFGYGVTGNQQIPTGRTVDEFGGAVGETFYDITGSNTGVEQGFRKTAIGNDDLKWEENVSYNLGIDSEFLDGRMSLVVDLYHREVDDLLFNPSIPATQGNAAPPFVNVGKMQNEGIDVSLGYRGTIGSELSWNVDINGSHYKNEIIRIDGQQDFFYGPAQGRGSQMVINQLGSPIGAFYGYKADGLFMNQDEVDAHADQDGAAPGRLRFADVNGDGQITPEDKKVIGSYHPDFTGGLNLGMQWKNFDFNTFLFASIGNDIFDITDEFTVFRLFNTNVRQDRLTKSAIVENGEVINPDAKYPRLDQNDQFSSEYSSFYVKDGSYLRMQNLEIGYNAPAGMIPGLSRVRFYVQAQNLFTITGYDNLDPAMPAQPVGDGVDASDQARGINQGTYPNNRIFGFGINASF